MSTWSGQNFIFRSVNPCPSVSSRGFLLNTKPFYSRISPVAYAAIPVEDALRRLLLERMLLDRFLVDVDAKAGACVWPHKAAT